ncbi:CS1 type fimbrial major subunit [Klebsiella oxytoca]|uniref:CS1 type fimbrial major subunit n=1 Tax=Klebsiella oxytoca TaxID=571 RepID=UPI00189BFC97|nr:CS1 type fimbrial major subunit [Klebsiella oxytoca]
MKKILAIATASLAILGTNSYADSLKKDITILANINDAIYVSKPDGSTWYDTEELYATDYKQKKFVSDDLKVRVWSTSEQFDVSLSQPLTISRTDGTELKNVAVKFADQPVKLENKTTIKQTTSSDTGYENTYTLKISAEAPEITTEGSSLNGSYKGDLVMLFEPKL